MIVIEITGGNLDLDLRHLQSIGDEGKLIVKYICNIAINLCNIIKFDFCSIIFAVGGFTSLSFIIKYPVPKVIMEKKILFVISIFI